MQLKFKLLFFTSLNLIIDSSRESLSDRHEKCYFINQESKETWKLVWQDNFKSEDYFKNNWVIEHGNCDEWDRQVSCNVKENVKLLDGCLVMSSKEEKYDQSNFTGAMLTTKRAFGYGRFEVRAALSVDRNVWSGFYTFTNAKLPKDGRLYIHIFETIFGSYYKALFPNNDHVPIVKKFDIIYSSFHIYGMEWSEKEVKFFVDNHYSEPILLNATRIIKPEQQIRLWKGVRNLSGPLPDKVDWKCPLMIMDYVRIYEKVSNPNVGLKVELCDDQNDVDQSSKKQRELVNSICVPKTSPTTNKLQPNNTSNLNANFESSTTIWFNLNSIVYGSFGSVVLLLILFIVHQRYRINKIKPKKPHSTSLNEIELENREYETITYDDVRETDF